MEQNILVFILVGFIAQLIDGALGMAYGVSSNTFLLSIGVPPALASASVHLAEVITTGISGFSHWRFGNIDKQLVRRLLIPGLIGGVVGAYILSNVSGDVIKPVISAYLLIMGVIIIRKAFDKNHRERKVISHLFPLGLTGGFFDAIGGGGWGPIVTTTLIARGNNVRYTVGSVNLAEFFVTFAESVTFILTLGFVHWSVVLGLLIGGGIAAPLAAMVTKKLPVKTLMGLVGIIIVLLSLRTIWLAFQ